jgi:hypothetical protein
MSVKYSLALLAALAVAQPVFADDEMSDNGACASIVKACMDAGYTGHKAGEKLFWDGCMKPLIMGKAVEGAKVDAKDEKACREFKIKKMQQELKEFQAVK